MLHSTWPFEEPASALPEISFVPNRISLRYHFLKHHFNLPIAALYSLDNSHDNEENNLKENHKKENDNQDIENEESNNKESHSKESHNEESNSKESNDKENNNADNNNK